MARRDLTGFAAAAEGKRWRMRLLHWVRPHRDRAEPKVAALPAEGLRLGPRFEDQLHRLGGALTRFGRVETIAQILAGCAAQQPDHQTVRHQIVEHCQILGDLHRIALRHDRAEDCDLYLLRIGCQMRRRNDRGRCQSVRRIVVLGHAYPVKAQLLDILDPFDHPAIGLHSGFVVVGIGWYRPFGRQSARRTVMGGLKKRDFHGRSLSDLANSRQHFFGE